MLLATVISVLIQSVPPPPGLPAPPDPPVGQALAEGTWWLAGDLGRGRQPDGNSVVFATDDGLVVVDTGRHDWHRTGIQRLAEAEGRPIGAILNSHWHLDHVIGNVGLKAAYPGLTVYATGALEGAVPTFLNPSREAGMRALAGGDLTPAEAADVRLNVVAMDDIAALGPDVIVDADRTLTIGRRTLDLHVTDHAATQSDLWVYDARSGVAAVGDLITLPVPYLDTACPEGWRAALDQVAAVPFTTVIPGHGRPMDRAAFETYRTAFSALTDCMASDRAAAECGTDWSRATATLQNPGRSLDGVAQYAAGYVEQVVRAPDHRARFCPLAS